MSVVVGGGCGHGVCRACRYIRLGQGTHTGYEFMARPAAGHPNNDIEHPHVHLESLQGLFGADPNSAPTLVRTAGACELHVTLAHAS